MATSWLPLLAIVLRLRRRRQALKPAQQILFGHAIELNVSSGFNLSLHVRIDHRRRRFRLGLVDLDMLLQRMDDILTQIAGRELAVANFAQRDNRILVVVAPNRDWAPEEIARARWLAIRTRSNRLSTLSMQSSTVTRAMENFLGC